MCDGVDLYIELETACCHPLSGPETWNRLFFCGAEIMIQSSLRQSCNVS